MANPHPHFLIITFPAQGHINPALELAKRLIGVGADVTFATTIHANSRLVKNPTVDGLRFSTFSDGQEEGVKRGPNDLPVFQRLASENLSELIMASANEGRPISCLIYSILIPGAAELARSFNIPSAFLWIQPATVLDIYYYYFNGFGDLIRSKSSDPSFSIELPGLPSLSRQGLPSFFVGSDQNQENHALAAFQKHLEILEQEENPKALVNTFDALEPEALRAVEKLKLTAVGPLVPSGFSDGKDASDTPSGGDLSDGSRDYMEWLKSKPESTVVYVSFGSISMFSMQQMEEIARGLLESGRPFLWLIRAKENGEENKEEDKLSCQEELEKQGMLIQWCSQMEVLSHPSLGCFVTHCGWNSSIESLASGVPMIAFPQWADQGTNTKLIKDVWKTGVRLMVNEEEIVTSDELKRCLELVMGDGEKGQEMRKNAKKWKILTKEALKEGGSSHKNLKNFVDEVMQGY